MLRRWILPVLFILSVGAAGAWLLLSRPGAEGPILPAADPAPPEEPAREPGAPFAILYGGELRGRMWVPPCSRSRQGGPARVLNIVDEIRANVNVAMVLDTGDLVSAPGAAGALEYQAGLMFLDAAGPSFAAVGERDLLLGLDRWRRAKGLLGSRVAVLCANLRDDQDRVLTAAVAPLVVGNLKAVVTAVLSPSCEKELRAAGVAVKILPAAAAVREALKAVVKPDFVVLLSHAPLAESRSLLRELPEVDVVVSAHAGEDAAPIPETVEGRLLLGAGTGWQFVGGASFRDPGGKGRPVYMDSIARPVSMSGAPPPPFKMLLDETMARARIPGVLEGSLHETAAREEKARYAGPAACAGCHPSAHEAMQKEGAPHARSMESVKARSFERVHSCLPCHTTAPGREGGHLELGDDQAAVTCEACHGPGAEHAASPGSSRLANAKASCAACHVPEMSPDFKYEDAWPKVKHGE